ncbi:DUF1513 domain-containing protein [Pseudaestuariivita rosea]|uniref:DUF1513 domain-containing protein n=1 Tax=Pseudaestuariivita rosea TaxID=2763263 RepID=UPI001ABB3140|nr:DUF1513 domain-containing protein [Pseudaestuariivita rosea]
MPDRRSFLVGLLAIGSFSQATWADVGDPAYVSAARHPSDGYSMLGLAQTGNITFNIPLPGRGHAAAAHPMRPLVVAFARRPGTFAVLIDCRSGMVLAEIQAPPGHHFSGHGLFSADGKLFFTGENDFENAQGKIGVWSLRSDRIRRVDAFSSGGIGPHDLHLMPDRQTIVIANGGIETHPDNGRAKLNISTMRPNLTYLTLDGEIVEQHEPPPEIHKNSIRHLAVRDDGLVAIATQWQGDLTDRPALLATHRRGGSLMFHEMSNDVQRNMRGYAGSIAFSGDGRQIAVTAPRGNMAVITDAHGRCCQTIREPDVCGVAAQGKGFMFTAGTGHAFTIQTGLTPPPTRHDYQWDNHLVPINRS